MATWVSGEAQHSPVLEWVPVTPQMAQAGSTYKGGFASAACSLGKSWATPMAAPKEHEASHFKHNHPGREPGPNPC